jgi:hypothetical protein
MLAYFGLGLMELIILGTIVAVLALVVLIVLLVLGLSGPKR